MTGRSGDGGDNGGDGPDVGNTGAHGLHAWALASEVGAAEDGVASIEFGMLRRDQEGTRAADGIASPRLTLGEEEELSFLSTSTAGVFALDSFRNETLRLDSGSKLRFRFEAVGDAGGIEEYEAVVNVPSRRPIVEVQPNEILFANEPLMLDLFELSDGVIVQVVRVADREEALTWSSIGADDDFGLRDLEESMRAYATRVVEIPRAAFPVAGIYRVEVSSYEITTPERSGFVSLNHGEDSVYAAGLTTTVQIEMVE